MSYGCLLLHRWELYIQVVQVGIDSSCMGHSVFCTPILWDQYLMLLWDWVCLELIVSSKPTVEGEVTIGCCQNCNECIFPHLDWSLSCIDSFIVWLHDLHFVFIFCEECFGVTGCLVVHDVEFGLKPFLVSLLNCSLYASKIVLLSNPSIAVARILLDW